VKCNRGYTEWTCSCGCVNPFKESWLLGLSEHRDSNKKAAEAAEKKGCLNLFLIWVMIGVLCCSISDNYSDGLLYFVGISVFVTVGFAMHVAGK
jgi:hypothetical protein